MNGRREEHQEGGEKSDMESFLIIATGQDIHDPPSFLHFKDWNIYRFFTGILL